MEESAIKGEATSETTAIAPRTSETVVASVTRPRSYAWWIVLSLVGLDCFSTLGYLPTIAVEGAGVIAPLAAAAVGLLILFAALPVYLYIVGRSSQGTGATGLLEKYISGWKGKLFILFLLGFVATDFVMTRALSTADASKHLLDNEYAKSGIDWTLNRKADLHAALPFSLQGTWTDQFFDWWDGQLIVTVLLTVLGFALYYFLLRGFTRGFMYIAAAIVALFLVVNGIVLVSSLIYIYQHPMYMRNWVDLVTFASKSKPLPDLIFDLVELAVHSLPALALGLSGFELSMTVAPLVRGRSDDDPVQPRGRIRNMRKLLVVTAVLMSLLVPASVTSVQFLVPSGQMGEGGPARHRALSYLAHGEELQAPGRRVGSDKQIDPDEDPLKREEAVEDPDAEEMKPERAVRPVPEPSASSTVPGGDLNPLFGPAFGTLYDVSAVLILFLAGASVTVSLRELLPQYLARYGMEMEWAQRIGVLLHLFNLVVLIVIIAFRASVSHQQSAYATSVLVLLAGAVLATLIDINTRWRQFFLRLLFTIFLALFLLIFLGMAAALCYDNPTGIVIALLFVAILFSSAAISRWIRSTELRYEGFTFADEESGVRWEQIRHLEFQVLVPHRPEHDTLAEKEAEIRARHRLEPDVPIIFIEAQLGDPSDFQQHPLMQIATVDGREVIRVSECSSIAHVVAAIALEFREVGRPPEVHFAWSEEAPLASNLSFVLFGEGNVPWLVHALIRRFEKNPARRPRVVIG